MQRIKELDFLKGVFILLMIAFHLVYIGDKYPYAKQIVYTFHMSGFLIISGYLTNTDKDLRNFMRKMLWIFIPYTIMEVGYILMSHVLPVRGGATEISAEILLYKVFLNPLGPYWYLHTLMICSIINYLIMKYIRAKVAIQLILFGLILFIASYWGGIIVFANAIYFLFGVVIRQSKLQITNVFRASWLAIVPLAVLCCFPSCLNRGSLGGIAITYLAISTLLYIAKYLPQNVKQIFNFIGQNTLVIFLFSPIFTILCKLLLPLTAWEPTGILFMLLSIIITVCGCISIAWAMDRLNLSRFFFGANTILASKK